VETLQGKSHTPSPIHPGHNVTKCTRVANCGYEVAARAFVASVGTLGSSPREEHLLPSTGSVKIVRINILSEHDVVVEVQKLAADAGNAVQVRLDGGGGERRQVRLIWKYHFVRDDAAEGMA
jgi:hypothetical protein